MALSKRWKGKSPASSRSTLQFRSSRIYGGMCSFSRIHRPAAQYVLHMGPFRKSLPVTDLNFAQFSSTGQGIEPEISVRDIWHLPGQITFEHFLLEYKILVWSRKYPGKP